MGNTIPESGSVISVIAESHTAEGLVVALELYDYTANVHLSEPATPAHLTATAEEVIGEAPTAAVLFANHHAQAFLFQAFNGRVPLVVLGRSPVTEDQFSSTTTFRPGAVAPDELIEAIEMVSGQNATDQN